MCVYAATYKPLAKLVVFPELPKKVYITVGGAYRYTCSRTYEDRETRLRKGRKKSRKRVLWVWGYLLNQYASTKKSLEQRVSCCFSCT